MTYEEVKKIRNNGQVEHPNIRELQELIDIAIEKQIPKKPQTMKVAVDKLKIGSANWCKGTTVYRCPVCKNYISKLYKYCFECGQKIDWGE